MHFTIYFAAVALFWYSLFTDPDLKNSPVQWLDGGKVFKGGLPGPGRWHNRCALAVFAEEGASIEPKDEAAVSKRLDV